MQEVKRMPARCSRPDNLAFSSPTLATLTLLTQRVLCPRRASEKAPDNSTLLPRSARLTRSILWVLASHRVCHPPNFLSDGLRSSSAHRTSSNCLCYPHTFPPPAWRGLPIRCPESQSPIGCCESPPSSGFSLLPTRRRGYPSGSVVLISCQTSTLVSRWAPMLAARKWRSSIRCRESWSPVGCRESLLVGRPKLFLSVKPIGPTCPMTRYCALVGGFMGPLDQIPPSVLWLAGADGQ